MACAVLHVVAQTQASDSHAVLKLQRKGPHAPLGNSAASMLLRRVSFGFMRVDILHTHLCLHCKLLDGSQGACVDAYTSLIVLGRW